MKHTPGPWELYTHKTSTRCALLCIHSSKSKENGSNVIASFHNEVSEDRANARLTGGV